MAIKDSAENWVRGKPMQALVLVVAIGLVIGGLVGLGLGYKIEQSRTRSDVKRLQNQIKKTGSVGAGPLGQRAGKVTASSASSVTVQTSKKGSQVIQTDSSTLVEKTATASTSAIVVGRRVLVSKTDTDVLVLATDSRLGRLVTNTSSTSFSIQGKKKGSTLRLNMAKVQHVYTVVSASLSDMKAGSEVVAGGRATAGKSFAAIEVILVPTGSNFVS